MLKRHKTVPKQPKVSQNAAKWLQNGLSQPKTGEKHPKTPKTGEKAAKHPKPVQNGQKQTKSRKNIKYLKK